MSETKKSSGKCVFCKQTFNSSGMTRHLKTCNNRKQQIAKKNDNTSEKSYIFHLLVQDAYNDDYWLHLEMSGKAKLKALDSYLRAIWLECCGHLSQFSYNRWRGEISMNSKISDILEKGMEIYHIYDFGTSSETKIKVVDVREGIIQTKNPIYLLSRNDPPEYMCKECGKIAKWLCIECMYNDDDDTFCDIHIESHPHDEYGEPIEIVNSPRLGMCGYEGPAEPPY